MITRGGTGLQTALSKVSRPDFLIVGAPKCGTTFLDGVLRQHPRIFQARKELHYFGSDLQFDRPRIDPATYLGHFAGAQEGQICGESSVFYMYSRRAAREIRESRPNARIVIMLRNPADIIESLHATMLFRGNEVIHDLRSALAAEPERRAGRNIPRRCGFPRGLLYREVVDLAPQVERYLDVFGRDQVHLIFFDDLRSSSESVVAETVRFLGLDEHPGWTLPRTNARHAVRSPRLQRAAIRPPTPIRVLLRPFLSPDARRRVGKTVARAVRRVNTWTAPSVPADPELRRELTEELRPKVEALEEVVGRSLSAWKRP